MSNDQNLPGDGADSDNFSGNPISDRVDDSDDVAPDDPWADDDLRTDVEGPGDFMTSVAIGMAAAPFLQAVASHFGTRLAEAMDDRTRTAVRRFLRRQVEENSDPQIDRDRPRHIELRTERGWFLTFPEDLPAEALAQLVDLCSTDPPAERTAGMIDWKSDRWQATAHVDGRFAQYVWDAEANGWIRR